MNYSGQFIALIVLWPVSGWDRRFLLPLLPLFFLYVLHGMEFLKTHAPFVAVPTLALPTLVLASYLAQYTRLDFGRQKEGVTKAESVEFFEYVKTATNRDDVFVFQKPRALALFADRHAGAVLNRAAMMKCGRISATWGRHILWFAVYSENPAMLQPFVARYGDRLHEEFRNADFVLYRIEQTRSAARGLPVSQH